MTLREKLFGFQGRLRRLDWWGLGILTGFIDGLIRMVLRLTLGVTEPSSDSIVPMIVGLLFAAPFIWVFLALNVKRMHDLNWPAWPVVVATLVLEALTWAPPGTLAGLDTVLPIAFGATARDVIDWTLVLAVLVVLGFIHGTQGPNRFGPSPKAQARPAFIEPEGVG